MNRAELERRPDRILDIAGLAMGCVLTWTAGHCIARLFLTFEWFSVVMALIFAAVAAYLFKLRFWSRKRWVLWALPHLLAAAGQYVLESQ